MATRTLSIRAYFVGFTRNTNDLPVAVCDCTYARDQTFRLKVQARVLKAVRSSIGNPLFTPYNLSGALTLFNPSRNERGFSFR